MRAVVSRVALPVAVALLLLMPSAGSADGGEIARGKELYARSCISCHGVAGEGVAADLGATGGVGGGNAKPVAGPPLRGVGARAADFYLQTGYMPLLDLGTQPRRRSGGERVLSESEIQDLVAYVASLGNGPPVPTPQPEKGDVATGMRAFTTHCAGCHQIVAEGGYVTGAVAPPLEDATAVQIAEAVRIGPYVMPTFPESVISDSELDSIIAYVQATKDPLDAGGWGIGHIGPVPEGLVAWFVAVVALVATCVVIGSRLKGSES